MGSSEKWSRALMAGGEGMQALAGYHERREIESARTMRAESLQRLRGEQARELADTRFDRDKELADKRYERDVELENVRSSNRRTERSEDRGYQDRRLDQQYLKQVEAQGNAAIKVIDTQIAEMTSMLDEAGLEGYADESKVEEMNLRVEALREQRMMERFKSIAMLRELGDKRYQDKDDMALLIEAGYPAEVAKAFIDDASGSSEAPPSEDSAEDSAVDTKRRLDEPRRPANKSMSKTLMQGTFTPEKQYGSNV